MATITGLTAERMLAIEAASVVDGDITGTHLILTRHDGSTIDAGVVTGPTGAQGPQGVPGTTQVVTYGTTFPVSPANGDEHVLVDSVTNPTWAWHFVYRTGITAITKWLFMGGAPYVMETILQNTTTSAVYVDPTNNVTFSVPVAGNYMVDLWGSFGSGSSGTYTVSLKRGGSATVDADTILNEAQGGAFGYAAYRRFVVNGLAAADILKMQWKSSGPTLVSGHRGISVQPIRCS